MRFHIKSSSYHHYACAIPTMPVLCPFITTALNYEMQKVVCSKFMNGTL